MGIFQCSTLGDAFSVLIDAGLHLDAIYPPLQPVTFRPTVSNIWPTGQNQLAMEFNLAYLLNLKIKKVMQAAGIGWKLKL